MTFRCGDIVLLPFPFTDLSAAIHLSMCKALECAGHVVMESSAAPYRPADTR